MALEELTRADIVELGEPRAGPCVTIFMPVRGIASGVREDQLRLSQLGQRALELMGRLHLREEDSLSLVELK